MPIKYTDIQCSDIAEYQSSREIFNFPDRTKRDCFQRITLGARGVGGQVYRQIVYMRNERGNIIYNCDLKK